MVSPTNGIHKANSIGIGSIGSIGATNQRAISGSAFITSEKAIEIIDAPLQGTEVLFIYSFFSFLSILNDILLFNKNS